MHDFDSESFQIKTLCISDLEMKISNSIHAYFRKAFLCLSVNIVFSKENILCGNVMGMSKKMRFAQWYNVDELFLSG